MNSKTQTNAPKEDATPMLMPKLRFPEFRDAEEWHVMKLNALLFEAKRRNRTLELGPSDVLSVSGEHGCVNQIEFMGRSYAGVTVKDYHVVEHGDIVYTKSPLKRNPYGIIKENKGKRGIVSTLYAVYRPFPGCSATYLEHFFSVDYNLNAYLQPLVKKGAKNDMKVNNADVLKGDICAPKLPEQQKIAECLSSVDELIAAQARKVDALKTHKKGLMQQLFPREGETQPRLRFPEFQGAGEWEEEELGNVVDFVNEKIPVARVALENYVSTENILPDYGGVARASKLPTMGSVTRYRTNDTLVSNIRPYLKKVWVADKEGGASNDVIVIRAQQQMLPQYLSWLLKNDAFIEYVMVGAKGVKMPRGDIGSIKAYPTLFPSKPEQQRIADCLTSLDDLIAAQTQKLAALKTHKQGLMQQLFPAPAAVVA
jgi:type I restriction enzyme S subunit